MDISTNQILVTSKGLEKLNKEYQELKTLKRPKAVDRVAKARDQGDLSENSEYAAAREELELTEARMVELESILAQAKVYTQNSNGNKSISIGSTVVVEHLNRKNEFTIVGSIESDPTNGKISNESPVGKALLGAKVGDVIEINSEVSAKYKILEIK